MKTRNGFVSNSSSSSFVIVKPPGDAKKVVADHKDEILAAVKRYYLYEGKRGTVKSEEEILALAEKEMESLLEYGELYLQNTSEKIARALSSIFKDYVIGTIQGGPDDASVILVSVEEVEAVLAKIKEKVKT